MKQLLLISIFSLLLFAGTAEATDSTEAEPLYSLIKIGYGAYYEGHDMLNLDIGLHKDFYSFSAFLKYGTGKNVEEGTYFLSSTRWWDEYYPREEFFMIGMNAGVNQVLGIWYFGATAGLGYLTGTFRGKYKYSVSAGQHNEKHYFESYSLNSICLPLKAEIGMKFGVFLFYLSYGITFSTLQPMNEATVNIGLMF